MTQAKETLGIWPLPKRIVFRVLAVYWLLYCLPARGRVSALSLVLPQAGHWLGSILGWPVQYLSYLTGTFVFHLYGVAATWHETGSGDTALDYVSILVMVVLALVAGGLWSAWEETRTPAKTDDRPAYAWLRLLLRFTLAAVLIGYGLAKVFPDQFGAGLSAHALQRTYADSSPMGLLWSFMAASRPYAAASGVLELIAALLLVLRRTTGLGALMAAVLLAQITTLNFCYDVPVKLYSVHLLLMAIFLALPEFVPLWRFFVERRTATPRDIHVPRSELRWLRYGRYALAVLMVVNIAIGAWDMHRSAVRDGVMAAAQPSNALESRGFHWVQEYPYNQ